MKVLTKIQHVQAKEHRMVSLNLEKAHTRAIAKILEAYNPAIDDAFAKADIKTNKMLQLEQQRLETEAGYTAKIREERRLANAKLEKERHSHKVISLDWHNFWIKYMARNVKAVDTEHKRDTVKLEKKLEE